MSDALGFVVMVAAGVIALWCAVPAVADRWISRGHLVGLAALEALMVVQAAVVVIDMVRGQRPGEMITFIGYLVSSVLVLPLAALLATMERTRWGAIIAGAGAVVVLVLQLRLGQLWRG